MKYFSGLTEGPTCQKLSQHPQTKLVKFLVTKHFHVVRFGQVIKPIAHDNLLTQLFLVNAAVFAIILESSLMTLDVFWMSLTMFAAALFYSKVVKEPAKQ